MQSSETDIYQRAAEKTRKILETNYPESSPDEILATLLSIDEDAEKKLGISTRQ